MIQIPGEAGNYVPLAARIFNRSKRSEQMKQGKHAPGGAYNYIINGNMIAGFALVAWPADYGRTGVMTFIVNRQGLVYQKDLGKKRPKRRRRWRDMIRTLRGN